MNMSKIRQALAAAILGVVLISVVPGCASIFPATAAERVAAVFDVAVDVLEVLDALVTAYLDEPDAIPADKMQYAVNATYDLMLARSSLESATDAYRNGDYAAAQADIKTSVGFMRDCVTQLNELGVNTKVVDKMLKGLEAVL